MSFERAIENAVFEMPRTRHETLLPCWCPCGSRVMLKVIVRLDEDVRTEIDHGSTTCGASEVARYSEAVRKEYIESLQEGAR